MKWWLTKSSSKWDHRYSNRRKHAVSHWPVSSLVVVQGTHADLMSGILESLPCQHTACRITWSNNKSLAGKILWTSHY
jgi:hypothetical protein